MPTILIKKSDTPGSVPGTANLTNLAGGAEVAVNTADRRMYSMNSSSAVVELGTNPSSLTCADGSFTLLKAASASITNLTATSLVLSNLSIASANITTLTSSSATITNLLGTTLTISGNSFLATSSGNVGIGTSSPGYKLDVQSSALTVIRMKGGGSANQGSALAGTFAGSSNTMYGFGDRATFLGGTPDQAATIFTGAAVPLVFDIATAEKMRLDSSGNLGLGVTPSAWTLSAAKAIQVGPFGSLSSNASGTASTDLGHNIYGGYSYLNSNPASFYRQNQGAHQWFTAPSGTAGNAITFTQAMTLTAASELYIDSGTSGGRLTFTPTGSNNTIDSTTTGFAAFSTIRTRASNHQWLIGASTQAMTLDASGNLLVGTTSSTGISGAAFKKGATTACLLEISGNNGTPATDSLAVGQGADNLAYVYQRANAALIFGTNNTERARITSAGNVGIGTTNPGVNLEIGSDTSTVRALAVRYSSVPAYLSNSFDGTFGLTTLSANSYNTSNGSASWSAFSNTGYGNAAVQIAVGTGGADVRFFTAAAANTNPTERARITSAGDMNFTTNGARIGNRTISGGDFKVVSDYDPTSTLSLEGASHIKFSTYDSSWKERARITSGGDFLVGKTAAGGDVVGCQAKANGEGFFTTSSTVCLGINRRTNDGTLIEFFQADISEGSISVSGNTVSYNAFAGSHWSQLQDGSKPDILRGTVMESINELCVWPDEQNERLPKSKISDTAGSKKVYGVFMAWDNDWTETNDMYVTAVGAFICRVNGSVTVQEGDLLESNGDGTARVQADDIIRSSTIGKVTSTVKTHQYDDGSYCVPTVLYCG